MSKNKKNNNNSLKAKVLSAYQKHPHTPLNYKQVSKLVGIKDKSGKRLVGSAVLELFEEKKLQEVKKGKYSLSAEYLKKTLTHKEAFIIGIVEMKQSGKAYIITDDLSEDVFINNRNTNKALDGDKVKVFLFPKKLGKKKTEGQIVEVLERKRVSFTGVFDISNKISFLIPDLKSMPYDIYIPTDKRNEAKNGQKVIVNIIDWPENMKNPIGEVVEILGFPGENDVEMQSILIDYGFSIHFPKEVLTEADNINPNIPKKEIALRRDFRKTTTFTIDPDDAKDFDDALSIIKISEGVWEVGVHIADVSHYVKPNSVLDNEAYMRGTSVYLVDRVIPMLPEKLSNQICSLRPLEDKLCFSAVFNITENGKILKTWFGKTIINSDRRFAYEEAQVIIENREGELSEEILMLNDIAQKMRAERSLKGALSFESNEVKFKLDEAGKPIGVYVKESKEAHKLIEEFMLLANRSMAEQIGTKKKYKNPDYFVYRIHDLPSPEKLEQFSHFVSGLGYHVEMNNRKQISSSFNQLFDDIKGKGEQNIIEQLAIRSMQKAKYTTENIGHYGLAFNHYTHFTSPIRRYPDLMVHRLLEKYISGSDLDSDINLEKECDHCTNREIYATKAERESVKYKQVEFMKDNVGQQFSGIISGISKWGVYVEIIENKCEGMISLENMTDDFYHVDEEGFCVVGQNYGNVYRLGDDVEIIVKKADVSKKRLDFIFVVEED